jgi:formylglycine-generating enzyme
MADDLLPEWASIPAGPFLMGSDVGGDNERPVHTVELSAFSIGIDPVTNAQYGRFVHETGYRAPAVDELPLVVMAGGAERERVFREAAIPYIWTGSQPPAGRLDHPVTLVRWDDAIAYCRWLSQTTGRAVRLPSEAEWEKAARGGLKSQMYPWGDELTHEHANYLVDPNVKHERGTTARRKFAANGYGLYDMAGNVWEWVQDWYDPRYYAVSPAQNPPGPVIGQFRIVRGGGWVSADSAMLTCGHRHQVPTDTYSYGIGFRVACSD